MTPPVARLDRAVTRALQNHAGPFLDAALSILTVLGNAEVTLPFAVLVGIVFIRTARAGLGVRLWAAVLAGSVVEWTGKHWLPHPAVPLELQRPQLNLLHHAVRTPYSYPSGHAFRTLLLISVIWLAWRAAGGASGSLARAVLVVFTGLMGVALIYLGDHWASQVIGGYLLGLIGVAAAAGAAAPARPPSRRV